MTAVTPTRRATVARANLSEDDVVAAALRLTRRGGLAGLSMRALADELGVTTMAAYYHVPSKDALLDLVANAVLDSVQIAEEGDWAARLTEQNRRMRWTLLEHPGLSTYLQERPLTAAGRRMSDHTLEMLMGAGFGRDEARLASATTQAFLLGRLSIEMAAGSAGRRAEQVFEYGMAAIVAGLRERLMTHAPGREREH
jgi:TetR/AcrR family tetracycline transcriptional repressor